MLHGNCGLIQLHIFWICRVATRVLDILSLFISIIPVSPYNLRISLKILRGNILKQHLASFSDQIERQMEIRFLPI